MINQLFVDKFRENIRYRPTLEQENLLISLAHFIFSPQSEGLFLLNGYAGSGKTSMVGALVKTLDQLSMKVILLAPTGRAAKVLSRHARHTALTIHRKIYRQGAFSGGFDGFTLSDNKHVDTLFIVDEASMIANRGSDGGSSSGEGLLDDLVSYVYGGQGCRLLLMGDKAQLPPVGERHSPALNADFMAGYGVSLTTCELTQVVRQSLSSGIMHNATRLRKQMESFPLPLPQIITKGTKDISLVSGEEMIEAISACYDGDGLEECIIITRSNKRANLFNQGVRNRILCREEELCSGDLLLVVKNNYFWGEEYAEIDFIANGDMARVVRVRGTQEMYGLRFCDVVVQLLDYDIELECKVLLDTLSAETPALPQAMQEQFFAAVMADYADVRTKAERIRRIKQDPYFNALQVKYGYAVTCHKAQGGEWRNVFLDMGTILPDQIGLDFMRWLYTAFTRPTHHLYLINTAAEYLDSKRKQETT